MGTEPQPHPAGRVVGLDVARGALLAYVVIVLHGVFWLGLLPLPWAGVLLFEMTPIFVITGSAFVYAERGRALTASSYAWYVLRRFVRILVPYWAYVLAAMVVAMALGASRDPLPALWSWLNPGTRGAGHTTLTLNWQLWFVPPFLAVTALLPFVSRIPVPKLPLVAWAVIGAGVVQAAVVLDPTQGTVQTVTFYALWAAFGVGLAAAPGRYGSRDYALVLALALVALALLSVLQPDATLDMQANKFPPNVMFFAFSCAWMAVLLLGAGLVSDAAVGKLAASPVLSPFIAYGYTLYLWQGIGYTAAVHLANRQQWSPWIVWPIGIAVTMILGFLASPLERIRIRRRSTAAT